MTDPIETTGCAALTIVLRCGGDSRKARYVFDTLLMAAGVPVAYAAQPPAAGPWLLYSQSKRGEAALDRCMAVAYRAEAWRSCTQACDVQPVTLEEGTALVMAQKGIGFDAATDLDFDLVANAFYFLASVHERVRTSASRQMYANSVFARYGIAQDIVDRYLEILSDRLRRLLARIGHQPWPEPTWPGGANHALVLSHDVDFLPAGAADIARQGAKTLLRHLVRQRDPRDAWHAMVGLAKACALGRDPYGCVPQIIEREAQLGVRSSFQVAVGHRHPSDVNYRIEDDRVRDYLRVIVDSGFDLCLHGSYRSTENAEWYGDEVALLTRRLGQPRGSRQHFLSFDYDTLFSAQERSGIQYDMSMGFPDRIGPRAGFSYPYFPYSLEDDRPYDVMQISLGLMDVTLRSYMGLKATPARRVIDDALADLSRKRGCMSLVWHPIVFGGARDPGYDDLYWHVVEHVRANGGLATDGRTINGHWRARARSYASFANLGQPAEPSHGQPAQARRLDTHRSELLTWP
jgi:hypothetical protein